jgi:hypothetical protein
VAGPCSGAVFQRTRHDEAVSDHVATRDRMLEELPAGDRPRFTAMLAAVERGRGGLTGRAGPSAKNIAGRCR